MGYTHGTSIDSKTRICTKCNKEYPNTSEYFYCADKITGRLTAVCKDCQKILNNKNHETKLEKNKDKDL